MVSYKKMNISGICLRYLSAFAAAFLFTMLSVNVASASPVQGQVSAEQSQISGVVVDENGEPIIGANVSIEGTTVGTYTDIDGKFVINAQVGDRIRFSYMGFIDKVITVDGNEITAVLQLNQEALDEVVVIGYGTAKRSTLTGALSQVTNESFSDQKVTRVDQALQGRATGIQITNTSGAPGSEVRMRIRGANSILGDNSPLFVIDGFVGADFNDLNPNDIKSIEVLKDASSTAIYGSRGANGVILVTTKTGAKSGKPKLSYEGNVFFSNIIKKYDKMNAYDFAKTANEHAEAMGASPVFTQTEVDSYKNGGGYDYLDAVLRTAISHQHQISVSGGNENTQYRVSGNYLNNQGIIKTTGYERYTVRANVNSKITDKLSFRFNANGVVSKSQRNSGGYSGANNILTQALAWAPTTMPYDSEGKYTQSDPYSSVKSNPISMMYDSESYGQRYYVNAMAGASYEIVKGLKADFQAGADISFDEGKSWSGEYLSNGKPSASKYTNKAITVQTTTQLSYDRTFGKHSVNAVAAMETQNYQLETLSGSASELKFPNLKYDNLAQAGSTTVGSGYTMWSLMSFIGRVNYSFDGRYMASVSVRHDGSSKFASGNKYSTFPAAALAWNAHNENFIKDLNVFSTLKLRLSWGMTGSQAISPYATLSSYNANGQFFSFSQGGQTPGIVLGSPGNPELRWETTEQRDLGLELGFFDNRLLVEGDVFWKKTSDLLMNKSIPDYQGGGTITSNIGSIKNTGFELSVTGEIIKKADFGWKSTFNFSTVKNEVLSLGDEEYITSYSDFTGLNHSIPEFIYKPGESLGSIYGLKYLGPWKKSEAAEAAKYGMVPGDARYEDLNNDYKYDGADAQIIGHGMPKYTLGWNNNIYWKNFTINVFFQGVLGVDKLNYTRIMNLRAADDMRAATLSEAKKRYIPGVQENTYLPAWSPTSDWKEQSSMTVEDASFVRLKNLSVAYDFDVKKIGKFTVSATATNLFTITGYKGLDPESSNLGGGGSDIRQGVDYASYPNARTFSLGLNITF